MVDGRIEPYIERSFSFITFSDALQFPATIRLTAPDGHEQDVELSVRFCAEDGKIGWEHGDFSYALDYSVDPHGRGVLVAGVSSGGCSNENESVSIIVGRDSSE